MENTSESLDRNVDITNQDDEMGDETVANIVVNRNNSSISGLGSVAGMSVDHGKFPKSLKVTANYKKE